VISRVVGHHENKQEEGKAWSFSWWNHVSLNSLFHILKMKHGKLQTGWWWQCAERTEGRMVEEEMLQFHFSSASHMRVRVRWREAIWNLQSSSCISELHFLTLLLNPSLQAGLNQHTSPWKVNQSDWIKQEKPWQEKCRLGLGFIERLCFSGFIRSCYAAWILEYEEEFECGKEGEEGKENSVNRRDWIKQKSHDRKNAGR
jgi:hypothetical protein